MHRLPEPRSHFLVGLRVDEDGALEIAQPAALFDLEFDDEGPLVMREVWIGETLDDDEYGTSELVGESDEDS
jgi:hypothetical protein